MNSAESFNGPVGLVGSGVGVSVGGAGVGVSVEGSGVPVGTGVAEGGTGVGELAVLMSEHPLVSREIITSKRVKRIRVGFITTSPLAHFVSHIHFNCFFPILNTQFTRDTIGQLRI
jgi:hypothetical protein